MKLFYLIFILLLFFPLFVKGASSGDVFINEIAWMGTENSYNDEWIELYNNTENNISLESWVLKADDGMPEINLTGEIPANGFYLLERTDDETVPGTLADLIYKGALGNDGENLKLYDNTGNLVDEVNCQNGWPAGDNKTKQTMERGEDDTWQTSREPEGTPKAPNSQTSAQNQGAKLPEQKLPEQPLPEEMKGAKLLENETSIKYPKGIVFNEILPSPEGPDETEEWVEIFNQNDFEVDLTGWQIKDKEGSIVIFTFQNNSKITALGYLTVYRTESKITLNNSGDGLELIKPDGEIADSISFEKALLAQSYNKTSAGWKWSTILTPGKENIIPTSKPLEQKPAETGPRTVESLDEKTTAAIGEKIIKPLPENFDSRSLLPLLIAFAVAIFSAGIILFLKKTRTNQSR